MRSDVHSAALRAAARVAFSVAFLTGCGGAAEVAEPGTRPSDGSDPATGTPAQTADTSAPSASTTDASAPPVATEDAGPCVELVDASFATASDYPGVKQDVSGDVRACCADLLVHDPSAVSVHRWDCCANLPDGATNDQQVAMACTPWGPPVPPSMKRRAASREVA